MKNKRIGLILVILGVLMVVGDVLVEPLHLGSGGGFGWKQITLLVVGFIFLIVGLVLNLSKSKNQKPG